MIKYIVDIFEGGGEEVLIVVTHIFYGRTKKEAIAVSEAHKKTDSFYRAAFEKGEWKGIPLAIEEEWSDED